MQNKKKPYEKILICLIIILTAIVISSLSYNAIQFQSVKNLQKTNSSMQEQNSSMQHDYSKILESIYDLELNTAKLKRHTEPNTEEEAFWSKVEVIATANFSQIVEMEENNFLE